MSVCDLGEGKVIVLEVKRVYDVVPEGGIARGGLVLVLAHEQTLAAASAAVHACVLCPPVLACEGSLGAHGLCDVILMRCKLCLKVFFALSVVLSQPLLESLLVLECACLAIRRLEDVVADSAISIDRNVIELCVDRLYSLGSTWFRGRDLFSDSLHVECLLLLQVDDGLIPLVDQLLQFACLFLFNGLLLSSLCAQLPFDLLLSMQLLLSLCDLLGLGRLLLLGAAP